MHRPRHAFSFLSLIFVILMAVWEWGQAGQIYQPTINAADLTGTLGYSVGGTGATAYTTNRLLKAGASAFASGLLSDDGTNVTLSSGQLLLPDGTASVPSAAFTTDPAQGLWLDTTNDLLGTTGLSTLGRLLITPLATPGSITVTPTGTTGATTYTYKLVALSGAVTTEAGAASSTATGNATLSATNYNELTWAQVPGATGYRIYRTVGGATQGLISTITAGATLAVNDHGLAGGGETAPGVNLTGSLGWGANAAAGDTFLFRDAANVLAQRNNTNAQAFYLYNTFTNASNYERLELSWLSNIATLRTAKAGTGSARNFTLYFGNTTTAALTVGLDASTGVVLADYSTSAALTLGRVKLTTGATITATSGTSIDLNLRGGAAPTSTSTLVFIPLQIIPTINYSNATPGAGSYEALKIAVTETALPTGTSYLARLSAGVAGTTDKFTVGNQGNVMFAGTLTSGAAVGLSATTTVRAAGGAADCTLVFTNGIKTGGTC